MKKTSPITITTPNLKQLSKSYVDFDVNEEMAAITLAFAADSQLINIDLTAEQDQLIFSPEELTVTVSDCCGRSGRKANIDLNPEPILSKWGASAAKFMADIATWDKKTNRGNDPENQLDAILRRITDDMFNADAATREKLRKKKKRKENQIKKYKLEYYGLKWRIEYIRLYSFVDKIMQKYFSDDTEFRKKYLLHKRYDLFKVGAQNEKAKVARVKSRVATIEEPKVIERKRLLGFAIFLLINAAVNKQKICENTVVHATWTWWLKNPKIKKSFDGKKVEMCNLKRRYFPNKKIEKQQWSDDGPDIIVQKGGLKNAPLFRFISRGLQSKDEDLVSAIKDLLNNFKKYTDRNANTIPFSQAVKLHDAAEAFYVKKSQPRFSCSLGGRKGLAKSIPSE